MVDDKVELLILKDGAETDAPRRKAERDVSETDGTDGRQKRMSLRLKARTDGLSVLKSFCLRDIRLCDSSVPSQSRRQTSPRRMPLRRMPPKTDAPETDGTETDSPLRRMPPETDAPLDGWN